MPSDKGTAGTFPGTTGNEPEPRVRQHPLTAEELVSRMSTAIAAGRSDQVTRLANLLKGAARRNDATNMYNLAALIESMGVDDKLDEIKVTMALLKQELSREHR